MTATKPDYFALSNHATTSCVALDELTEQFTALLVGSRESGSVSQLRRDLRRKRNQAVRTTLRIIRDDLHSGKSPEETAAFSDALSAMIRGHSKACAGNIDDEIVAETDIESVEDPLEARVLRGDESRPTLIKLARTFRHHVQNLKRCERAVNAKLYGEAR